MNLLIVQPFSTRCRSRVNAHRLERARTATACGMYLAAQRPGAAVAARRAADRRRVRPPVLPRAAVADAPVDRAVAVPGAVRLRRRCRSSTSRALLAQMPVPIPAISDHADDLGVLALEDLGDVTLQAHLGAAPPAEHAALYRQAVALIATLQRRGAELDVRPSTCPTASRSTSRS